MDDENIIKVRELLDKIEKTKKKPSDEEKVTFMEYWSEVAKTNEHRAIRFLLRAYVYDASRIFFNYLMSVKNQDNYYKLLSFFIEEKYNKDEKNRLAYCKILFELAAFYLEKEDASKEDLYKLLYIFDQTHKPEEYFYSSFIQNIPQTIVYPDYSLLRLNYYSAKNLNSSLLKIAKDSIEYIQKSFKEKDQFKDDKEKKFYEKKLEQKEEKIRRINVFIDWVSDADSKLILEKESVNQKENSCEINEKKTDITSSPSSSEKNDSLNIERFNELENSIKEKNTELEKKEDIIINLSRQIEEYKNISEKNLSRAITSEKKCASLTDEIEKINKEKEELNNLISSMRESISLLKKEIEERKNMNDVISSVESKKSDETMKKIASKLKIEYDEFKEAQAVEMSVELGEVLKDIISNIFDKLNKSGIKVE